MLDDILLGFALWRAERLQHASEWWTDVASWLSTGETWDAIRARRKEPFPDPDAPRRTTMYRAGDKRSW